MYWKQFSSRMKFSEVFPHERIRPGQDALIKDIEEALDGQKILLAHAPTGLGKTASALSAAVAYAAEKSMNFAKPSSNGGNVSFIIMLKIKKSSRSKQKKL